MAYLGNEPDICVEMERWS